jgi:hypothetical protein
LIRSGDSLGALANRRSGCETLAALGAGRSAGARRSIRACSGDF